MHTYDIYKRIYMSVCVCVRIYAYVRMFICLCVYYIRMQVYILI